MRLIDADALLDVISRHSYLVAHGVGFYDVDYGMTIDGIRQCIDKMPPTGWISVKDKLPKEDGKYLVWWSGSLASYPEILEYSRSRKSFGYWDDEEGGMIWYRKASKGCGISHWMNLPEPPEGVSDK